ncbi:AAA family ATPase [Streptomyces sp. NPDC056909]|uniref:AAA family ATPase n=1 Tax=Streptomyces sp. NPDC056909 TaxID=3345963 RepID=UPI00367E394C
MTPLDFPPGTVVVLVGASGSGKSTFAARYPASWRVCLDEYRLMATDDMTDQSATPIAARVQRIILDARLARGLTTVVDSTNVQAHIRAGLLARARHWQRDCAAVLFDVPLAVAETQNAGRDRAVPADVLRAQHQQLPTAAHLLAEGFTDVRVAPVLALPGAGG